MKLSEAQVVALRRSIGRNIAAQRKQMDPPMTQYALAVASGCRPEAISRIERGVVDFGVGGLIRIAAALEIGIDDLLPRQDTWALRAATAEVNGQAS